MKSQTFDTVVVGSGTSAYYAVSGLSKAGQRVAIIDERPYGGTCALRGCQPKKYLVSNAEAVAMATHLVGKGIVDAPQTNWSALQNLKDRFLQGRSENEVINWQKKGVATFHGKAHMTADDEITVGSDVLRANNIILATGAVPRHSDITGAQLFHDSEYFLALADLPKRIVFIGGGYISFEFAHVAIHTGAESVTIMHRSERPLKAFDEDIVKVVLEASEAAGIETLLDESPVAAETAKGGITVHSSKGRQYQADLIIEATGRIANLSVLDGSLSGVDISGHGVVVNEYLQSVSNPRVYAIGDCAATPYMLAPVADEEGKTVVYNILEGNNRTIDYSIVPSVVFTIPNIGTVGLTESQAREKGLDFRINQGVTTNWPSSKRIGERHGAYKILIDKTTDEIIGAHLVRHNASEVINVFAFAMKHHLRSESLREFPWAYPTYTSDLKYMVG